MAVNDNRWQSMPINQLILIIDEQSIVQVGVIIDCHRLALVFIDYQYESINMNRLIGIDCHRLLIDDLSVTISKRRSLLMYSND